MGIYIDSICVPPPPIFVLIHMEHFFPTLEIRLEGSPSSRDIVEQRRWASMHGSQIQESASWLS